MSKKRLRGTVVSTSMDKTVVVSVDTSRRHKVYKKLVESSKKYKARNDLDVKVGDVVIIEERSPLSKTVTWQLVEKLDEDSDQRS